MKYCVLFPEAKNVHLIKDVGMIAYKLSNLFKADSVVSCYNNDDYEYINTVLKGLRIEFINKRFNNDILDGSCYLKNKSSNIDVLQLFHVNLRTVIYTLVYKHYNSKGKIFLKLDCTEELLKKIKSLRGFKKVLFNYFFRKLDIIGVEQKRLYNEMKTLIPNFARKVQYIPNGIDFNIFNVNDIKYQNKENYILHVGRMGSKEKNSEMLVRAFIKTTELYNHTWKLLLVGDMTSEFKNFLSNIFLNNPQVRERIEYTGEIKEREKLIEIYKKTKIFCLTSHYESFSIALLEAAACGNMIISTKVGIAEEMDNYGSRIIEQPDDNVVSQILYQYMESKELESFCYRNIEIIKENYNWDKIVEKILNDINRSKS